jgi:anti-anti-sigma factor
VGSDTEENRAGETVPGSKLGGDLLLSVSSQRHGSRAAVEISGELDLSGTEMLKTKLREVITDEVDTVEIDASVGLTLLLAFRLNATKSGVAFRVVAASDQYVRVVRLAGLDTELLPPELVSEETPDTGG